MHILVAHNQLVTAAAIAKALRANGMMVDVATDGDMAMRLCGTSRYDVLVMAHDLPGAPLSDITVKLNKRGSGAGVILLSPAESEDGAAIPMASLIERVRTFDKQG